MKPGAGAQRAGGQIAHTVVKGTPAILEMLLLN
jgi:hypothetical protein